MAEDSSPVKESGTRRLRRKVEFVDQFMRKHRVSSRRASDEFEKRERGERKAKPKQRAGFKPGTLSSGIVRAGTILGRKLAGR